MSKGTGSRVDTQTHQEGERHAQVQERLIKSRVQSYIFKGGIRGAGRDARRTPKENKRERECMRGTKAHVRAPFERGTGHSCACVGVEGIATERPRKTGREKAGEEKGESHAES